MSLTSSHSDQVLRLAGLLGGCSTGEEDDDLLWLACLTGGSSSTVLAKPLLLTSLTTSSVESEIPPEWEQQETNVVVVELKVEWQVVSQRFHASLKQQSYHIIRIQRIQVILVELSPGCGALPCSCCSTRSVPCAEPRLVAAVPNRAEADGGDQWPRPCQ